MSKSKTPVAKPPPPPIEVDQTKLAIHLMRDIARSWPISDSDDPVLHEERLDIAIEIVQSLSPADVLETQLIVQMMISHTVAIDTLRRASRRNDDPYIASMNLRDTARFMNLYREQMRSLTRYRGTPHERRNEARHAAYLTRVRQGEEEGQQASTGE